MHHFATPTPRAWPPQSLDMSDLIVDFPQPHKVRFKFKIKVNFSSLSKVRLYDYDVDTKEIWYSGHDYEEFKMAGSKPPETYSRHRSPQQTQAKLYDVEELTGIKNILAPGMLKKSKARRKCCWKADLDEQERQNATCYYDNI